MNTSVTIEQGYRPGIIGRIVEMHALYYARTVGFGQVFERNIASGLAEFTDRLEKPMNGLWAAIRAGTVVGSIAIDGEDMAPGAAHLRWFIVDDGLRGGGIGRLLLSEAIAFCESQNFPEIRLKTFSGLTAARHLYDAAGFRVREESPGTQWGSEVLEQYMVKTNR